MGHDEILALVEELKKYDNEEGYNMSYRAVKESLSGTVRSLAAKGESTLDHLHPLLTNEETWSALFAIKVLREIKSEKSIPYLINFIWENEFGEYWDGCEDAMFALVSIGRPAVAPLLKKIKSDFEDKVYHHFLIGSLTKIKDEKVYSFMKETVEDYIKDPGMYREWFRIGDFVYDLEAQGRKEILPLLRELYSIKGLSEYDRIEIQDTISVIEDPERFRQNIIEKLGPLTPRKKIGRNKPCPCGSGKKYKKCCMKK